MNLDLVRLLSERMTPAALDGIRRNLCKASLPIYKEFDAERALLVPYMRVVHELHDCVEVAYGLVVPSELIKWDPIPDRGVLLTLDEYLSRDDFNGMGFFATETQYSNVRPHRAAVAAGLVRPEFTHVLWFRRGVDYGC